jgi:glyoxylase-like metal-dependent hydrolase (beta-lactamase superfamily II)
MDRRAEGEEMIFRAAAVAATLAFAAPALAQPDFAKVEIKATKLSDTTYMLAGAGGNIGLSVGEDAVFLVDDQYAPLTDKIRAAIAAITPKPVRFVLNTHWHGDHVGGNENFGKAGAVVVAHENVRKRMSTRQFNDFFKQETLPSAAGALPIVTFTGTHTFHVNGEELRVLHMPNAHTDGDAVVHFLGSDVIHMGDIFWYGIYPFIDNASGGSVAGTIAACDRVLAIASPNTKIIPGHGPLSDAAGLKEYRDMLATIAERVRRLLAEGKTVEQVAAAGVSAEWDEKWGKRFLKPDKFAEMIARDLARK